MAIYSSTITDLMSDKMTKPYYRTDGSDDYIDITSVSNSSVGVRDLTTGYVEALFRTGKTASGKHIVCFGDTGGNSRNHMICTDGNSKLLVDLEPGNVRKYSGAGSTTLQPDTTYHVLFVHNGTTPKVYLNGVEETITFSITADKTVWNDSNSSWNMGSICSHRSSADPRGYYELEAVYRVRLGNHVPSDAEIKELYSGASIPFKYKGASQTNNITHTGFVGASATTPGTGWTPDADADYSVASSGGHNDMPILTITRTADTSQIAYTYPNQAPDGSNISETLTPGKKYRASIWVKSGTAGNVSAVLNVYNKDWGTHAEGQPDAITSSSDWQEIFLEFVATGGGTDGIFLIRSHIASGSGTQLWSDPKIVQLGVIAEYDGSGIASDKWFDKSGNDFHGTVYGASVENAPSGDDGLVYEEGTWSPTWYGASGGGSHTFTGEGKYTRIGNMVYAKFDKAAFTFTGEMGSGTLRINGLPFVGEVNSSHQSCATDPYYYPGSTWQSTNECGILFIKHSNTDIIECRIRDVGGDSDTGFPVSRIEGESNVYFGCNFIYRIS